MGEVFAARRVSSEQDRGRNSMRVPAPVSLLLAVSAVLPAERRVHGALGRFVRLGYGDPGRLVGLVYGVVGYASRFLESEVRRLGSASVGSRRASYNGSGIGGSRADDAARVGERHASRRYRSGERGCRGTEREKTCGCRQGS